jgi:hypothetical protein
MPNFHEVFEFEGQNYIKSKRDSSEVKVGDVVRILNHHRDFNLWTRDYSARFGKCFEVSGVSGDAITMQGVAGLWLWKYFEILEPAQKTNPRPHAELIKQWADDDSLEIEFKGYNSDMWDTTPVHPAWSVDYEYRIKSKTVPAWQVLYEDIDGYHLSDGHYKTEENFNTFMGYGEKFIKFILETEKQVKA